MDSGVSQTEVGSLVVLHQKKAYSAYHLVICCPHGPSKSTKDYISLYYLLSLGVSFTFQ